MTQAERIFPRRYKVRGFGTRPPHVHNTKRAKHEALETFENMAEQTLQSGQTTDYVGKILSEKRKAKKPLMEKMRRARINDSLNELKYLVLDALNKDASRYSKMEKADVLEMAVQHLRELKGIDNKRQDAATVAEYRTGLSQCTGDLSRNIIPCMDGAEQLRASLLSHLASSCYQGNFNKSPIMVGTAPGTWLPHPSPLPSPMGRYPTTPELSRKHAASTEPDTRVCKPEKKSNQAPRTTSVPLWRPW